SGSESSPGRAHLPARPLSGAIAAPSPQQQHPTTRIKPGRPSLHQAKAPAERRIPYSKNNKPRITGVCCQSKAGSLPPLFAHQQISRSHVLELTHGVVFTTGFQRGFTSKVLFVVVANVGA